MSPQPDGRRHRLADLYHERTNYQFIERSWRWAILSGTLIAIAVGSLLISGLNLGIDFTGGTQWQFTMGKGSPSVADVRVVVQKEGVKDPKVLIVGGTQVRVQSKDVSAATKQKIVTALERYGSVKPGGVSINSVGSTWGKTVSSKALQAMVAFFILIAIYLSLRFEWKMALAAIIAVIHDIVITVGVYAVTQFEVTPATVVAFLTILGYSLYDTVVVFDKIGDNTKRLGSERGDTYSKMVNRSMNQVLMRSINTSLVALLPVASLLIVGTWLLGAVALRDFSLALFVGLLTGAYSSIFVASPVLAWLKEREPKYVAMRDRAELELARAPAMAGVAAGAGTSAPAAVAGESEPATGTGSVQTPEPRPAPRAPSPGVAPRPRQQRRRKRR
jgi:preprotein translocase subunit SecF